MLALATICCACIRPAGYVGHYFALRCESKTDSAGTYRQRFRRKPCILQLLELCPVLSSTTPPRTYASYRGKRCILELSWIHSASYPLVGFTRWVYVAARGSRRERARRRGHHWRRAISTPRVHTQLPANRK